MNLFDLNDPPQLALARAALADPSPLVAGYVYHPNHMNCPDGEVITNWFRVVTHADAKKPAYQATFRALGIRDVAFQSSGPNTRYRSVLHGGLMMTTVNGPEDISLDGLQGFVAIGNGIEQVVAGLEFRMLMRLTDGDLSKAVGLVSKLGFFNSYTTPATLKESVRTVPFDSVATVEDPPKSGVFKEIWNRPDPVAGYYTDMFEEPLVADRPGFANIFYAGTPGWITTLPGNLNPGEVYVFGLLTPAHSGASVGYFGANDRMAVLQGSRVSNSPYDGNATSSPYGAFPLLFHPAMNYISIVGESYNTTQRTDEPPEVWNARGDYGSFQQIYSRTDASSTCYVRAFVGGYMTLMAPAKETLGAVIRACKPALTGGGSSPEYSSLASPYVDLFASQADSLQADAQPFTFVFVNGKLSGERIAAPANRAYRNRMVADVAPGCVLRSVTDPNVNNFTRRSQQLTYSRDYALGVTVAGLTKLFDYRTGKRSVFQDRYRSIVGGLSFCQVARQIWCCADGDPFVWVASDFDAVTTAVDISAPDSTLVSLSAFDFAFRDGAADPDNVAASEVAVGVSGTLADCSSSIKGDPAWNFTKGVPFDLPASPMSSGRLASRLLHIGDQVAQLVKENS